MANPERIEDLNPASHPQVVAIRTHLANLTADLEWTKQKRAEIERDLGATAKDSDEAIEARLLADGVATDGVAMLRDLRRHERVVADAIAQVAGKEKAAVDAATRELTPVARERFFLPGAKAAVAAWLAAAREIDAFDRLVGTLQGRGLGNGTYCVFNQPVPITRADPDMLIGFARELVREGFATRDQINDTFPNLI